MTYPLLVQNKYGVMRAQKAYQVLVNIPGIKMALNKTQYFMSMLKEKHPEIECQLKPESEYIKAKENMLFMTKFGLVKTYPDALMSGHMPTIQSAVNRKEYFKNQLISIYGDKYDFKISTTDRHTGRVILICPIHGEQSVDSDGIFLGKGCPKCNKQSESNIFYIVKLYNNLESFYKLGISHYNNKGKVQRFANYINLGYNVEEIWITEFNNFLDARTLETKLKRVIKNNLYQPKIWNHNSSKECFSEDLLSIILKNLKHDIVSTSTEMQSSCVNSGQELATPIEDK